MNQAKILAKNLNIVFILLFTPTSFALSSDANLPLYFQSDSIVYNKEQHQTTYIGHVHITQGTTRISGNRIVIQYGKNDRIDKIIDTGNLAHYTTLPDQQSTQLYAQAKKITFNANSKIVTLEANGKVTQEKNVFTGPHIWYDIVAGVVRTTSKKNQETVIVIQPQNRSRTPQQASGYGMQTVLPKGERKIRTPK